MIVVIITKGVTYIRGNFLLESLWKVVDVIIDTHLMASVCIHDVLHGFRAGRGKKRAYLELKLAQELASVDQDPLFLVFLDLKKA